MYANPVLTGGALAGAMFRTVPVAAALVLALLASTVHARPDGRAGGKLLLTNGISTIEGASGGGLTPWATIAGNETKDGIGGQASATVAELNDYDFRSFSGAVGIFDRVELSFAQQRFDTNKVGGKLGLGNDYAFRQDIWGAKVRLFGDLVFGPELLPAVAVGVQYKKNLNAPIVRAVGAKRAEDAEFYVSATKLFLRHSVLLNATLRYTRANQFGLLGYGGDKSDARSLQVEASAAYQISRKFAVGGEFRSKPDNLGIAREDDAIDLFAAYAIGRHVTATLAYTDLGSIATEPRQRGALLQLQAAF